MKARGGAREFEGLRAVHGRIEGFRLARRGSDQLDAHVVEGVDQNDEPLGSAWVRSMRFEDLVKAIYTQYPDMRVNSIFRG